MHVPPPVEGAKETNLDTGAEDEPSVETEPGPPLIRVEANDIPEDAAALAEFVPPGWKLAQEVRGDLDGNGSADAALVLARLPLPEDEPPLSDDDLYRDRVLLVVLAAPNGRYRRVGFSGDILACTQCGGAFWASIEMPVELEIANAKIRIAQEYGSRSVTTVELILHYSPAHQRVLLSRRIDRDHDRLTGDVSTVDVDYETGVRATLEHVSNMTNKKMETVPRANVYLETVKFSESP